MKRWLITLVFLGCADATATDTPWAVGVVDFSPGDGAGFNAELMPGIALGPPAPGGVSRGSLDVVSLGLGGTIVLDFGASVPDGPGPDIVVFENAFVPRSAPDSVFAEYGRVGFSDDGVNWVEAPCSPPENIEHCAGRHPVPEFDTEGPLDPELCGGDQFDLKVVGVQSARFVRIVDMNTSGAAPTAGFDLDALARLH